MYVFWSRVVVLLFCTLTFVYGSDKKTDEKDPDEFNIKTVTSTVTRSHTVRLQKTTDVIVTSAVLVPLIATQYETKRNYVRDDPNTVTSYVRITEQPVVVETSTVEKFPVRTVVSTYTDFRTRTSTVELWQAITHYSTSFEIESVPVEATHTLYQVSYETITTTTRITVTVAPKGFGYGYKVVY